jgi:hypothetical protein
LVLGVKTQSMYGEQFFAKYGIRAHSDAIKLTPHPDTLSMNETIAREVGKDHFLNPLDLFCDGKCPMTTPSGFLLFFDGAHLAPEGAKFLAPRLRALWGDKLFALH